MNERMNIYFTLKCKMLQSFGITSNITFENISIYYSKSIVYIIYYSVELSLTIETDLK